MILCPYHSLKNVENVNRSYPLVRGSQVLQCSIVS